MKQELSVPVALQIVVDMPKRAPMSVTEQIGVQAAIDRLEALNVKPTEPAPAAVPPPA